MPGKPGMRTIDQCNSALDTLAQNTAQAEIPTIVCLIVIAIFMKFNQHEARNQANKFVGNCLGIGFLMLFVFIIIKGFSDGL